MLERTRLPKRLINLVPKAVRSGWLMLRGRHPSQMWGRVFDLSKKELVELGKFDLYVMPDDYIGYSIKKQRFTSLT